MPWAQADGDGVVLTLFIKPRASRTRVVGLHEGALAVQVAAPPVDGAANQELLHFLAKQLGVPKGRVTLLSGDTARHKRVRVDGVAVEDVMRTLAP